MHLLKLIVVGLLTAAVLAGGLLVTTVAVVLGFGSAIARRWLGSPAQARGPVSPPRRERRQPMKRIAASEVTVTNVPVVRAEPLSQASDSH